MAALEALVPPGGRDEPVDDQVQDAGSGTVTGHAGVRLDGEVARLDRPGEMARLRPLVPARLDLARRQRMATQIARTAAAVAAEDDDVLAVPAALRPVPRLLAGDPADLQTSSETLRLCAELVDLLRGLSDDVAARQVATDGVALATRWKVCDPAADRLAAASLSLAAAAASTSTSTAAVHRLSDASEKTTLATERHRHTVDAVRVLVQQEPEIRRRLMGCRDRQEHGDPSG